MTFFEKAELIVKAWKNEIKYHKNLILISIGFFILANFLNLIAGRYTDQFVSVAVADLILDYIPSVNLWFLFSYGYIVILGVLILYPFFFDVKKLHVVLSQFALLVMVRSFFIILTHLKTPEGAVVVALPKIYNFMAFNNDLFFSGHTSMPFLGYLILRGTKLGTFFLVSTFVMALTVLLMHYHYSIDVFAAFFITYGSYKIGEILLNNINN